MAADRARVLALPVFTGTSWEGMGQDEAWAADEYSFARTTVNLRED